MAYEGFLGPLDHGLVKLYGDQAVAYGDEHRVGPVVGVEFTEYRAYVVLDRLLADAEYVGDSLV